MKRRTFLGGSDAAAVMGLSPYMTPVELWQRKTGREQDDPTPDQIRMRARGHKLEPFIRDMVIDKLRDQGCDVELLATNARYTDREHPFLSCEIDFELRVSGVVRIGDAEEVLDGEEINADAKSVHGFARRKWGEVDTEDVPIEYAAQFMHGLGITGRRLCLVAALRSFDDVDIYWTRRDDETIAAMRDKCVRFWIEHVLADVPPDPIVFDDIKALFPVDNGLAVEASDSIRDDVLRLRIAKAEAKKLEEEIEALTFRIAEWISPHTRLTYQGTELMTWKGQNDTRVEIDKLAKAELYEPDPDGKLVRIPDPKARFSRTKVIRVLRFVNPKKGKQ